MWLSNTSAAAMVMPIVEAVAQQIIKAETEADELEMSCSNGSINPALELDGRHAGQFLSVPILTLQWTKYHIKQSWTAREVLSSLHASLQGFSWITVYEVSHAHKN